jgi:outer membrane protein assembly factor BamB
MPARFYLTVFLSLLVAVAILVAGGCSGSMQQVQMTPTPPTPPPQAGTNVLTYHNDIARTGQNLTETTLTPTTVNATSFAKLFSVPVDGKVDAQPLYVSNLNMGTLGVHSVAYAATEHGSLYAIDVFTGAALWRVTLLGAGETPSDDRGCSQVTPEIGITATPVIDLTAGARGIIYALAMS